ncbi:MAG: DNA-binding protein [Candidatus Bathyarchaeia archaeon]
MASFDGYSLGVYDMSDDLELERLRRRKLAELRRKFTEQVKDEAAGSPGKEVSIDDVLRGILVGRAWEVLAAAEAQYPRVASEVKRGLALLAVKGRIKGPISGEQLMWFFRRLGVRVRLETKIRFLESGELKSLAEKLRGG